MKSFSLLLFCVILFLSASCSEADKIPSRKVGSFTSKIRGYIFPEKIVISQKHDPLWIQNITTGYNRPSGNEIPSKVGLLSNMSKCHFIKPRQNEFFASVFSESGNHKTSIYTRTKKQVSEDVKNFIKIYTSKGEDRALSSIDTIQSLKVIDVFVTETEKPVYLALISKSKIIWNIHKASNVKISHVALIGDQTSGVANIDEDVPIETLTNQAIKRCNIFPAREPKEHWILYRNAQNNLDVKEALNKNIKQYLKFSKWFTNNFGVRVQDTMAQANRANHFLIGNIPENLEERIPYMSLNKSTIRVSKPSHLFVADRNNRKKRYELLVTGISINIAGGELAHLNIQN